MFSHQEQIDFSKFGKSFQEKLCHIILDDRSFADQIGEVLKVEFFELKYLQLFSRLIYAYKGKYGTHPTRDTISSILRTAIAEENETAQTQIRNFFARILSSDLDLEGEEYVKEKSLDFCRKQKLKEAMIQSAKLLQSSSFDEISKVINEALKLGNDNDYGYDYLKDFERRFLKKDRDPISTGWREIDNICVGGLGKGELGVVIAPTGAGKSMALVRIGAAALEQGKTVIHYSFELQDSVIASRYDSCITGINLGDLHTFKEQILEKVQEIEGRLIIKEYPTKSATTETLKNHLYKLKQRGIEPDLLIVDYGDLLKPINNLKEKRYELGSIYEELRAIAKVNECPLWIASQTNRSGLNAEVITMESISEAFSKCFVADFIFSLSRTIEDKSVNAGRVFIAKNRNGIDGIVFPIFMDTKNVNIEVLKMEDPTVKVETTMEEQKQVLREKYKQFRNGEEK